MPAGTREGECQRCGTGIYWIRTAANKPMPIDCYASGGNAPTGTRRGRALLTSRRVRRENRGAAAHEEFSNHRQSIGDGRRMMAELCERLLELLR